MVARIEPWLVGVVSNEEVLGLGLAAVDLGLLGAFETAEEGAEGALAFVFADLLFGVVGFLAVGVMVALVLIFFLLLVEGVVDKVVLGDVLVVIFLISSIIPLFMMVVANASDARANTLSFDA